MFQSEIIFFHVSNFRYRGESEIVKKLNGEQFFVAATLHKVMKFKTLTIDFV